MDAVTAANKTRPARRELPAREVAKVGGDTLANNFTIIVIAILSLRAGSAVTLVILYAWMWREMSAQRLLIVRSRDGSPLRLPQAEESEPENRFRM